MDYDDLEQHELDDLFIEACEKNNLIQIKYLLKLNYVNIHCADDYGLRTACKNKHLNLVKYLLTAPDLKEHANIHASNDDAINRACSYGNLDIVKYLLTSSDLKEHANIHAKDDQAFKWAYKFNRLEVIKYLILDYKITKTEHIDKVLQSNPNKEIEDLFNKRDLKQTLENELHSDKIELIKKIKL